MISLLQSLLTLISFYSHVHVTQSQSKEELILYKCSNFISHEENKSFWSPPAPLLTDPSIQWKFRLVEVDLNYQPLQCSNLSEEIEISYEEEEEESLSFPGTRSRRMESPVCTQDGIKFISLNGSEETQLTYNVMNSTTSPPQTKLKQKVLKVTPMAQFTPNGHLIISASGEYFRPHEFCIQGIFDGLLSVKTCEIVCNEKSPCVPLCCPLGHVISLCGSKSKCISSGVMEYSPTFYHDPYNPLSLEEKGVIKPHFIWRTPQCKILHLELHHLPFREILNFPKSTIRMLKNGKVVYLDEGRQWKDFPSHYCISGLIDLDEGPHYSGLESDQIIFYCLEYYSDQNESNSTEIVAPFLYIPVLFISSFFLLLTALVYIMLWEKQNVHGWTVLSFVLSMFFMFVLIASSHLLSHTYHDLQLEKTFCFSLGAVTHFFFLSTFCWLTIINFDLWWTFKSMAPISGRSKGIKRFICYMIFAWGLPTLIITVGITLYHLFPDVESEVIVPDYGRRMCFLSNHTKGVYLHYIIGVLMLVNFIFMILTVYTIYKFKEGTRAVDAARSNNSQNLSLRLFIKLFVVMGLTWVFELIGWWQSTEDTLWYWIILDMFNICQSIGIFLIFVCKRNILNQLEQKYPFLKVVTGPLKKIASVSRKATRTITTTSGPGSMKTTGFSTSGRKSQLGSSKKTMI